MFIGELIQEMHELQALHVDMVSFGRYFRFVLYCLYLHMWGLIVLLVITLQLLVTYVVSHCLFINFFVTK